ncbi:MAG: hypothetical protein LH606_04555 [Cytophagaceae bacterium]|nr:hypothetical protein [Cytophagaceae bacterium]
MELREQILQEIKALSDDELVRLSNLLPQVRHQNVRPADPARFEEALAAAAEIRDFFDKKGISLSDDLHREREDRL